MKLFGKDRTGAAAVTVSAAVVVVALAVLQYRWNADASDATGVRLADALQLSMVNWHLDLFRNLSEVCLTMRMPVDDTGRSDAEQYADRLQEWRSLARYPDLVANVYIVRRVGRERIDVMRLEPGSPPLDRATLPPAVADVVRELEATSPSPTPPRSEPIPARQLTESFYNIGSALQVWRFDSTVPALVRSTLPDAEWILVELNQAVLQDRILPDLAHRYFQGTDGLDYEVAVVAGVNPRRVIYSSDPGFGEHDVPDADGRMDVFGRASDTDSSSAVSVFHRTSDNRGPTAAVGISWFPLMRDTPPEDDWQLVVRHRRGGSLGSFVESMRRRGLAVSFGALLLLVVSMSMLVVTSSRAQRLAKLQMDFVTAVSHELRTPLTIIGSAADNLGSGVVDEPQQIREYGSIIGNQVGQLSGLVERVLLFAATRNGQQRYVMQALRPAHIVDTVLASTEGLIRAAHVTVERDIPPDLPPVTGDLMAVSQCVENLVTNALKYGKEQRWIGIRAAVAESDAGRHEVRISVSDRGMGIDPADLPHIFEPFYRSASVRVAQIHGTGLGLALAAQIAHAMGGTLSVSSTPGQGSTFTLTLQVFTASLHTPAPAAG